MNPTFESLFGLQFCHHNCGAYIGFSENELSEDQQSFKPLEIKTGEIHDCPKEGWSKQKPCIVCSQPIMFHNSRKYPNGKKIRFSAPGVKHHCQQKSEENHDK